MNPIAIAPSPDLTERVYQAIQQAICAGELPPGTRLTQEELAARLAVSRQPVLQALRLLKRDGFVVEAPAKGFSRGGSRGLMVSALDAAHIRQVYQVRAVLDGLAARTAAQRKVRLPAALIDSGRRIAAGEDVTAKIDADIAFHDAIYAACGNPYVAEAAQRHWQPIRRAMGAVLNHLDASASVWDEHATILEAIARGDALRAERLACEHGELAGEFLAKRIEAQNQAAAASSARPIAQTTTA